MKHTPRTVHDTKRYYGTLLADLKLEYAQGDMSTSRYEKALRKLLCAAKKGLRNAADYERRCATDYHLAQNQIFHKLYSR